MPISVDEILEILSEHGISPLDDEWQNFDHPEIGTIQEGEDIYTTSLTKVIGTEDDDSISIDRPLMDDPRLRSWWEKINEINKNQNEDNRQIAKSRLADAPPFSEQCICAWYCPIHFFGHSWGIYIREECILETAINIALLVDWTKITTTNTASQLLRSAFYVFFLHEQFHHKVESLGFRLLITTSSDRYRNYKSKVYQQYFLTKNCLEESLANAESYIRVGENRYKNRLDNEIFKGLRNYLKLSFKTQSPGYKEALDYLTAKKFHIGQLKLQSQILEANISPKTPYDHWNLAPNVITSLFDITKGIYVVLPHGAKPIFPVVGINPGATVSTKDLAAALTKHNGYQTTLGGKGSHVKLTKPNAPPIILPGNRSVLSPGVVKQVLNAIGGFPISKLPEVLQGKLHA